MLWIKDQPAIAVDGQLFGRFVQQGRWAEAQRLPELENGPARLSNQGLPEKRQHQVMATQARWPLIRWQKHVLLIEGDGMHRNGCDQSVQHSLLKSAPIGR